jgi:2-keto-4-pentenoate hydratase
LHTIAPEAAARLVDARRGGARVTGRDVQPADRFGAYAIQDATLLHIGPLGGWKVGAASIEAEPHCAPLPGSGILASGVALTGPAWDMRGVEVEVAVRLGRDLGVDGQEPSTADVIAAIAEVLPVIEVIQTRLADWKDSDPLAQLADLGSHGALVLGSPSAVRPAVLDLRQVRADLTFDGQPVASTFGANSAVDVWRELRWLACECARRGQPLRAGTVITTGSCTGTLFAPEGALVQAEVHGMGRVALQF